MTEAPAPPLSRISPVKKLLIGFLVLVGLIPIGLLIAWPVYGVIAKRAFNVHVAELEDKGESLEIVDHVPAVVKNPEDNFAEEPVIREIIRTAREASEDDSETAGLLDRFDIKHLPGYERGIRERRVRVIEQAPLNENFPDLTEKEAAEMILEHCSGMKELDALVRAARRPAANFDLDYEAEFSMKMDGISAIDDLTKLLLLRARASLITGNTDQAVDDLESLMQLSEHFFSEPFMIFLLIGINWRENSIALFMEGLQKELWTEAQLARIEKIIPEPTHGALFSRSMRMERAILVDKLLNLEKLSAEVDRDFYGNEKWLNRMPKGYQYDNARMASELIQQYLLEPGPSDNLREEKGLTPQVRHLRGNPFTLFRYALATMPLPVYDSIDNRLLRSEIFLEQTRVAVTLEKIRIATGEYPEDLSALQTSLPLDPFTRSPMIYRKEDDSYVLYSVGVNGVDEGGLLKRRPENGDYVWRLKLPEDFDREDYLSRE